VILLLAGIPCFISNEGYETRVWFIEEYAVTAYSKEDNVERLFSWQN